MMELRPYQEEAVSAVVTARERGLRRVLYTAPTGTGKTQVFVGIHQRLGGKALVLAHREELLDQAANRFRAAGETWVDVEQGGRRAGTLSEVIAASVQTLARGDRLSWFRPGLIVVDECFPAGTLVDGRPIETIQAGDLVSSYNHEQERCELRRVVRRFQSFPSSLVRVNFEDGQSIFCTPSHPFFAVDLRTGRSEYVAAGLLTGYHLVYRATRHQENTEGVSNGYQSEDVRGVRHGLSAAQLEQHDDAPLLGSLQSKAARGATEEDRTALCGMREDGCVCRQEGAHPGAHRAGLLLRGVQAGLHGADLLGANGADQPRIRFRADEAEEPDARSCRKGEDEDDPASDGLEAAEAGRERATHRAATAALGCPGMGNRSTGADGEAERVRISGRLQSGHRECTAQSRYRGGRRQPQQPSAASRRSEAGCPLGLARVDGVEVLEPGSVDGSGRVCPTGPVYNLEVEGNHNYFADGFLVHNCHHVCAESYRRVLERFGCFAPGGPFLVGCTATPKRLDRLNLHTVFEEQVYAYSIRQAIEDGWLCDVRGYRVKTNVDLSRIRSTAGDFNQAELSKVVNTRARTEAAIKHWRETAADRLTVVFCVDRAHARAVAETWREAGFAAEHIDGSMGTDERRAILERFRRGETRVLVNVELLTEGWDCPAVSCAVMLRPTQSWALYVQMVGRTTRICDGKADSIILDVVDISRKHSLASVPAILDLPEGLDLQGKSIREAAEKLDELGARAAAIDPQKILNFADLETLIQQVDLFANVEPPAEVTEARCRLHWLKLSESCYYVSCGEKREARITADQLGRWSLVLTEGRRVVSKGSLAVGTELKIALWLSDKAVLRKWPESLFVAAQGARWRKGPATDKQVSALRRFGVAPEIIQQLDRGGASGMLTQLFARKEGTAV